jgi:hypothetical protein
VSNIPYPRNFDQNLDEARHERRYAMAVQRLDPGDVIAAVESAVAAIADPKAYPLYGVVASYLEAGGPHTGRLPWSLEALAAAYDALVKQALDRLIDAQLADHAAWGED